MLSQEVLIHDYGRIQKIETVYNPACVSNVGAAVAAYNSSRVSPRP